MSFEVRRPGVSDFTINDLGQKIPAGATIDLLQTQLAIDIATSENLRVALQAGNLIRVKSSIDQTYANAYNDLYLETSAPQISASAAESEGDRYYSISDSVAERGQSMARLRDSYSLSIARRGESVASRGDSIANIANSVGERAESLGRLGVDPSEARSIGGRAESLARIANSQALLDNSIADYAESLARLRKADLLLLQDEAPSEGESAGLWIESGATGVPWVANESYGYISLARNIFVYNKIGPTDGTYLGIGATNSQDAGYYLIRDAVITYVWSRVTEGSQNLTKSFELRNLAEETIYQFNLPNGPIYDSGEIEVYAPAGTVLVCWCSDVGSKVENPIVQVEVAWIYS